MFGPDICGYSTKKIHAIITHEGKNMLIKKNVDCETDTLSHVYTFVLSPNNTFKILTDGVEKAGGSIFDEWEFLKPKEIPDPSASKVRGSEQRVSYGIRGRIHQRLDREREI